MCTSLTKIIVNHFIVIVNTFRLYIAFNTWYGKQILYFTFIYNYLHYLYPRFTNQTKIHDLTSLTVCSMYQYNTDYKFLWNLIITTFK